MAPQPPGQVLVDGRRIGDDNDGVGAQGGIDGDDVELMAELLQDAHGPDHGRPGGVPQPGIDDQGDLGSVPATRDKGLARLDVAVDGTDPVVGRGVGHGVGRQKVPDAKAQTVHQDLATLITQGGLRFERRHVTPAAVEPARLAEHGQAEAPDQSPHVRQVVVPPSSRRQGLDLDVAQVLGFGRAGRPSAGC